MTAPARLAARGRGASRRSRRDAAASSDMRLPRARRQPKWAGPLGPGFRFQVSCLAPLSRLHRRSPRAITGGTET